MIALIELLSNRSRHKCRYISMLVICLLLPGCATLSYYSHLIKGHMSIMRERQPISELLESTETDSGLQSELAFVQAITDFSFQELGLPDNSSYRTYADIGRPYVTWNVVSVPSFSMSPRRWCFLITGCISYRGFFNEKAAHKFAEPLREEGNDVYVYGAMAYSTLGWFSDPVLNTMLEHGRLRLAAVIFHELAHQQMFIKNDVAFNEAFATAVQRLGVQRWLALNGNDAQRQRYAESLVDQQLFLELVDTTRSELEILYQQDMAQAIKQQRKQQVFERLLKRFEDSKQQRPSMRAYERWFTEDLNNAKLVSVATYYDVVPYFERLFVDSNSDFSAFYEKVAAIAELPPQERQSLLRSE